ncbi:MAG TPA: hypothetical protein VFI31_04580 [Pirellulales bacterium]|nr:hypothetical protein [Pirellulales bacterium]
MNDRTSRRGFIGIAAGALASLTGTFSGVFGRDRRADHERTPACSGEIHMADTQFYTEEDTSTTYTYDDCGRLIAVSEPIDAVVTAFTYE